MLVCQERPVRRPDRCAASRPGLERNSEYFGDEKLVDLAPRVERYVGWQMLLAMEFRTQV